MKEPIIDITDLSKSYGKTRGIEKLNLEIGNGEVFGFIGPNGAGKSTTIRILMNLIFPTRGSARIMGMDVVRQTKEIMRKVGYLPSDANAYSYMEAGEFLNYMARFHDIPDAAGRIRELSKLLELDLKRKISDLSSGNKRKVSIIQSLVHRPEVLIMDEPTTGLDPLMQTLFFDLMRSENRRGTTIFFSSHILGEVQMFCRRVAIIKEGSIVQVEDIDTLRKKQLKKVFIEFGEPVNEINISIRGVVNPLTGPGNSISFMFSGDINELTGFLSGKMINNLMIEEPSLDEIFMHYYQI
jgi:ABC-2 type transport system ATP-binding protein